MNIIFNKQKIFFLLILISLISTLCGCGTISQETSSITDSINQTTSNTKDTINFIHIVSDNSISIEAHCNTKTTITFPSSPSKVTTTIKDQTNNIVMQKETGLVTTLKTVTISATSSYNCANISFKKENNKSYTISSTIYYYKENTFTTQTIVSSI